MASNLLLNIQKSFCDNPAKKNQINKHKAIKGMCLWNVNQACMKWHEAKVLIHKLSGGMLMNIVAASCSWTSKIAHPWKQFHRNCSSAFLDPPRAPSLPGSQKQPKNPSNLPRTMSPSALKSTLHSLSDVSGDGCEMCAIL